MRSKGHIWGHKKIKLARLVGAREIQRGREKEGRRKRKKKGFEREKREAFPYVSF